MKVFGRFSEILQLPLISWKEWLNRLRNSTHDVKENPAVHLLDFYERASPVALINREAPGIPLLDLTKALESSHTLRTQLKMEVSEEEATRWIQYWKDSGLLVD